MSAETQSERLESLRKELRGTSWLERKYHRSLLLNKNRPILGEVNENERYTEEFVRAKAVGMKKKSLTVAEYQQLQTAFLQCEENINAFLGVDNALYSLVRELSGNNPDLQVAAASCCCNIALGNTKACTNLAKAAVPYLLATLDGVNYNLMDICIWTIGNLAAGSEKAFQILHAQSFLQLLSSMIQKCELTLLPSVVYATLHTVYAGSNFIEDSEMIELIEAILRREIRQDDHNMIWSIAILSSRSTCVERLLNFLPSVIGNLYEAANSDFSDVIRVTAMVRILGNSVSEPTGYAANLLLESPKDIETRVEIVLDKLLLQQHAHLRRETLWLIGNLCNHSKAEIAQRSELLVSSLKWLQLAVSSVTSKT